MNVYVCIHSLIRNDERTSPREGFYETFAYLTRNQAKNHENLVKDTLTILFMVRMTLLLTTKIVPWRIRGFR